jgi:hypothetical protein
MLTKAKQFLMSVVAVAMIILSYSKTALATGLVLTDVTVDVEPVFAMALIVITAIAAIWAIKKVIKLGNRS